MCGGEQVIILSVCSTKMFFFPSVIELKEVWQINHEFTTTDRRLKLRTAEIFPSWKFEMLPSNSSSIKPGERCRLEMDRGAIWKTNGQPWKPAWKPARKPGQEKGGNYMALQPL